MSVNSRICHPHEVVEGDRNSSIVLIHLAPAAAAIIPHSCKTIGNTHTPCMRLCRHSKMWLSVVGHMVGVKLNVSEKSIYLSITTCQC